jgi:hypothetical protein
MTTNGEFAPRALTASEYVRELFRPGDNAAILVRNRSVGHAVKTISKAETIASPPFQNWLAGQNTSGYDVFMGMNPIRDGVFSRTKRDIKDVRHIYLDLDRNGDQALEAIRNSSEVPPPNFVLDTSPGNHQVVWKVSGFAQDEAEAFLHNLADKFGGDLTATDSTRVLRLPGIANRKLPEEFFVQARQESDSVDTLGEFTMDQDPRETPRHLADIQGRRWTLPSDHKAQSERDWAYAKRALARGDDPEVAVHRIAECCADNKENPNSCARHTVTKAQVKIEKRRRNRGLSRISDSLPVSER